MTSRSNRKGKQAARNAKGRLIPSVTTIIDGADGADWKRWAAQVEREHMLGAFGYALSVCGVTLTPFLPLLSAIRTAAGDAYACESSLRASADFGTTVHNMILHHRAGRSPELASPSPLHRAAFARWLEWVSRLTETVIVTDHEMVSVVYDVSGKLDELVLADGVYIVRDFKTSGPSAGWPRSSAVTQVSAYLEIALETGVIPPGAPVRCELVRIGNALTDTLQTYTLTERERAAGAAHFRALVAAHRAALEMSRARNAANKAAIAASSMQVQNTEGLSAAAVSAIGSAPTTPMDGRATDGAAALVRVEVEHVTPDIGLQS